MMDSDRIYNAIINSKWGFIEKVITFICPFIVRTVLIYRLGAEYSGISSLYTSVLSFLNLAELGLSNAIVFHMYKPISENKTEQICSLLNYFKKAYLIIGAFILLLGLIISPFIPKLIKSDVPVGISVYVIYWVFLANSVIGYFMFSYKISVLSACQREDIISKNYLIQNIVLTTVQCLIIYVSRNYYLFVLAVPLCTILLNILNSIAVKKQYPLYYASGSISVEEKKQLRKELYGLMIWKIGGASRNSFDSMFISSFLGLLAVTAYDNYFQIVNGINMLIAVLCTSINAGVGNKIATKSTDENYKDFNRFHFLYMWIAGWCVVCLYTLFQPFMKIWMGEKLMLSNGIVILFCYYFFMMKKGDINSVYYHAAGLWWDGRYRSIIEAILNLFLNYIFIKKWGLFGVILATIISFSIVNIYGASVVFTRYFKNSKYYIYFFENILFLMVISCLCLFTNFLSEYIIFHYLNIGEWGVLIVKFLLCIFVPNIGMLIIYGLFPNYRMHISYAINVIRDYLIKNNNVT